MYAIRAREDAPNTVTTRIRIRWNKFPRFSTFVYQQMFALRSKGQMLYGSETMPDKKDDVSKIERDAKMVR